MKDNDNLYEEGYITNYFINKIQLSQMVKKQDPKVKKSALAMMDIAKAGYKKFNKKPDLHVVGVLETKKGNIQIIIDTRKKCMDSPCAFLVKEKDPNNNNKPLYGIYLNREFLNDPDIENQLFILMHEMGHIALGHVDDKNSFILGVFLVDYEKNRLSHMHKGKKVIYEELHADLYAFINGAKIYPLLSLVRPEDVADGYDIAATNNELSLRYNYLYKYRRKHEAEFKEHNHSTFKDEKKTKSSDKKKSKHKNKRDEKTESAMYNCIDSSLITCCEGYISDDVSNFMKRIYIESSVFSDNTYDNDNYMKNLDRLWSKCVYEDDMTSLDLLDYDVFNTLNNFIYSEADTSYLNQHDLNRIYMMESLTKSERDKIPDNEFGIPETRSYPLDTEKHVRSAIKLFWKAPEQYKDELARNILKAMKKFGIPRSEINPNSALGKHLEKMKNKKKK